MYEIKIAKPPLTDDTYGVGVSKHQDIARKFCQDPEFRDNLLFVREMDTFAVYDSNKGHYQILDERAKEFDKLLLYWLVKNVSKGLTVGSLKDIKTFIKFFCLSETADFNSDCLALTDKLLDMNTFAFSDFDITKHVFYSALLSSVQIENQLTDTPPDAPLFFKFLDEIVVDDKKTPDKELQALVQEMFGYCLLPFSNNIEAFFFLVGEGSNGKSVLLNLLREIVGTKFCSPLSIEALTTDKFAAAGLVGKRLNICSEEESDYIKSDKFKAIVSGEPILIERKYGDAFSAKLSTKFIYATNEIPSFSGLNHGLLRRIRIIPFNRLITLEERDVALFSKLKAELPAITIWALTGAKRLAGNGFRFSQAAASDKKIEEFKEKISAAIQFLRETYEEAAGGELFYGDMYAAFVIWCKDNGKKQMSSHKFHRDITRTLRMDSFVKWNSETRHHDNCRRLVTKVSLEDALIQAEIDEKL